MEQNTHRLKESIATSLMLSMGFSDIVNYCFTGSRHVDNLQLSTHDVRLLNPLNENFCFLRSPLLPDLLDNFLKGISYLINTARLFEFGTVFSPLTEGRQHQATMPTGAVLSDICHNENIAVDLPPQPVGILDVKRIVECILKEFDIIESTSGKIEFVHPAQEGVENFCNPDYALLVFTEGTFLGSIGMFDLDILRSFGIKNEVFYYELNFDAICELKTGLRSFSSLSVYSSVNRPISLVAEQRVPASELLATAQESGEEFVELSEILDVLQGNKTDKGKKSVAVLITYRSPTKTLTEKNVEKVHTKIVKLLTDKFGGSFRDA